MRRFLVCALALLLISILTGTADEADFTYVSLEDGGIAITNYSGGEAHLTIPGTIDGCEVRGIASAAFVGCDRLLSVVIPEGVRSLGSGAFADCSSLQTVDIPASLTEVGANPFLYCVSLYDIRVDDDNPALRAEGGVLFDESSSRVVCYSAANRSAGYALPEGTRIIGDAAFFGCSSLSVIELPDGLEQVGSNAFSFCASLCGIEMPSSVECFGAYAFSDCASLYRIEIPEGVSSIPEGMFSGCGELKEVVLPATVIAIGEGAFEESTSVRWQ